MKKSGSEFSSGPYREWKGRGIDMEEARLQSAYDEAALVYTRNQALSSVGKPDPAGHAGVMTFTTDGTNINFFAYYAAPSENGTLKYHPSNSPRGEIFEVLFIPFQE